MLLCLTLQELPNSLVTPRPLHSAKYAVADSKLDIKLLIGPCQHWVVYLQGFQKPIYTLATFGVAYQSAVFVPLPVDLPASQVLPDSI